VANPLGLPPDLQRLQNQEDLEDQRAYREIARRQSLAAASLRIEKEQQIAKIQRDQVQTRADMDNRALLHGQNLRQQNEVAIQSRANANLDRSDEQAHMKAVARIAYNATSEQNTLRYAALKNEGELDRHNLRERAQITYNSSVKQHAIEYSAREKEAALTRSTIAEKDRADERMQSRELARISKQRENISYAAQEQRRLIEASRAANLVAPKQNLLEYGPD
jgi:hypothetical protein